MVSIPPRDTDQSLTPRCQNGIHRTHACPTCGESLTSGPTDCINCGSVTAAGTTYITEPCPRHRGKSSAFEYRPRADPLLRALAESIRRVAIAEWDDADGVVVAEGYPLDQARAVLTTLSDLVAFIPEVVDMWDHLPFGVREAAVRAVSAGRCDSCGATGFRVTFSPEHTAHFCDGCYERESGHECGRPVVPGCDGCRTAFRDAFGGEPL